MNDPWPTWFDAARRPAVSQAIEHLYAELDAAIARRGPTCWASGKCCKFDSYGHRLYVTALEIAWLLSHEPPRPAPESSGLPIFHDAPRRDGCPFQTDGLCGVHAIRPLGCRVFFCQHGTQAWQQDVYEDFLGRLRRLHDDHAIEYRYMEWRLGLSEAASAAPRGGR